MKEYLIKKQESLVSAAKAENREMDEAEKREFDFAQELLERIAADEAKEAKRSVQNPVLPETKPAVIPESSTNPDAGNQNTTEARSGYSSAEIGSVIDMCRSFSIEPDEYIKRGLTPDETRTEILEVLKKRNKPVTGFSEISVTEGDFDKRKHAVSDGLMMRSGIMPDNPAEGAGNYRNLTLRSLAEECIERESGTSCRYLSDDDIFERAVRSFYNPESAFPAIVDEVVKKSYTEGLKKARASYNKWVKFGSVSNFKKTANHEYIMALVGELEKVPENGELKAYNPKDVIMPERKIETFGRQFTMTRQAFIDDDIGLLTTMPYRYAAISENTQNRYVYDYLLNNKVLERDNKPLFDASRKNTLKTGTKPTLDIIEKMIYMIGIQKDEAGNQLALIPDLFIVPFGMGVELKKILSTPTFYSAEGTVTNPYYNAGFEVVEDVTLNGFVKEGEPIPWFMGMKGEIIQVDYLNGQKSCSVRRMEKPGVLGFIWDVYIDFGVSVLHPQAVCRNPGVKIGIDK